MAANGISTREKFLSIIDDFELIAKELVENMFAQKGQRLSAQEHAQLMELLIQKDSELKDITKLAAEQAEIEQRMQTVQAEVNKQDEHIKQLQKKLKEAEQLLATAIYQAKQKLQSIAKANKRPVSSEELIRFAHRISASNAVCAPLTWQQGDPRRPYPTDIEMRMGFLGRMNDMPLNGHINSLTDALHRSSHLPGSEPPSSQHSTFSWHPSGEIHMAVGNQGSVAMDTRSHKDNEDVEVMSTDSSSSSSSDSQ